MDHQTFFIKALTRLRSVFAEIKFTIDIIFYQWDVVLSNNVYEFLFLFIRHQATQGVAEVGDEYTRFDGEFADHFS